MPISQVGTPPTPTIGDAVTSIVCPLPATGTRQADDLIVAVLLEKGNVSWSAPAGWTRVLNGPAGDAGSTPTKAHLSVWYWRRGAADPTDAERTFTASAAGDLTMVSSIVYRGVGTGVDPVRASAVAQQTAASTTVQVSGTFTVSRSSQDQTFMALAGAAFTGVNPGDPAWSNEVMVVSGSTVAMTERLDYGSGTRSDGCLGMADLAVSAATSTITWEAGRATNGNGTELHSIGVIVFKGIPELASLTNIRATATGTGTLTDAAGGGAAALDSSVTATATGSAALSTEILLAAAATVSATGTGSLAGQAAALESSAAAAATATADLSTQILLAATASAAATATAALAADGAALESAVSASATATAALSTQILLAAAVSAVASASAGLTTQILLATDSMATASSSAEMSGGSALAAGPEFQIFRLKTRR